MNDIGSVADLLAELENIRINGYDDPETGHVRADDALLAYINVPEVTAAFNAVSKWYA